jgi:type IV fimbrial biogenesis protein FimT
VIPAASRPAAERGMTLIEIMITLAIMGILMMIGMPSFNTWLANTQVRTGAEGLTNGLQLARAEAVRRNGNISFVLGTNTGWTVSVVSSGEVIQSRSEDDGSKNATVTVTPAGATTLTFNGYGRVTTNADASASITRIDVGSSTLPASETRALRITLGSGGNVRMCDPALASGDPRAC